MVGIYALHLEKYGRIFEINFDNIAVVTITALFQLHIEIY